jgi:hypothetical protein
MSHKQYRSEKTCLNCGSEVSKKFCPECGQENLETRESFFHLVGHFVSDYFHFDSKFFRSLIPLFTKPGFLTREYWEGRRVHYIHPLRMFFFITIIFMISTSLFYKDFGGRFKEKFIKENKDFAVVDTLGKKLTNQQKAEIVKEYKKKNVRMKAKFARGFDDFFKVIKYATFFLLPVYALVFKILYRRRRAFYVDHLVYAMHLQSFAYMLIGVIFLLPFVIPKSFDYLSTIANLVLVIYIGLSLHFLYKQVWWKTVIKSVLATFSLVMITGFSMLLYALIDAMIFQ